MDDKSNELGFFLSFDCYLVSNENSPLWFFQRLLSENDKFDTFYYQDIIGEKARHNLNQA